MSTNDGPQGPGAAMPDIRSELPNSGRLPRVGKLRLGIKKEGSGSGRAVSYPSAVDYFVVKEDMSTSRAAAAAFHEVYGDEPRELDVTLPAATIGDVLRGVWRSYGSGGLLKRRCTGPGGTCEQRDATGVMVRTPCQCQIDGLDPEDKKNHCQERFTLTIMLMRVRGVGVWQLDTGSRAAADKLHQVLILIASFRGHLQGAQATLRVVPQQVSPKGVAKTVYHAELEASDITPEQALAISAAPVRVELPASTLDDVADDLLDAEAYELAQPDAVSQVEPQLTAAEQIKNLNAMERGELYRLAGIPRGTRAPEVRTLLEDAWEAVELGPFSPILDVKVLLRALLDRERDKNRSPTGLEAFDTFAKTGVDIDPGDQTTIGEAA